MHFCHSVLISLLMVILFGSGCQPREERDQPTGYLASLHSIGAKAFFNEGLRGSGVKIGILDLGFGGLYQDSALSHLITGKQIALLEDLCPDSKQSFWASGHGTLVLKFLAGIYPNDTIYGGSLARDATFYLIRAAGGSAAKEDSRKDEYRIDSAFALLHSLGVRLVNLSIGFWNEFSDQEQNYSPQQMDGQSTLITRICSKWADSGMIIVNSAGNTGEYAWRYIWAPADARDVITAGGCRFPDMVFKASYSGRGNPAVPFVKPDMVVYTPWGTSLTAPVITGIIACMIQKENTLTPEMIRNVLHRSASLYPYPNNFVGYGIPDAGRILAILAGVTDTAPHVTVVHVGGDHFSFPAGHHPVVEFRKKGPYLVSRQVIHHPSDSLFTVKRRSGISHTTVAVGLDHAWEIIWE